MYSRLEEEVITAQTEKEEEMTLQFLSIFWGEIYLLGRFSATNRKRVLTVPVVVVDLFVWIDLNSGSQWDGWHAPLQLSAHHQVVVFINSFELLFDAESLAPRIEDHLSLPEKHAT